MSVEHENRLLKIASNPRISCVIAGYLSVEQGPLAALVDVEFGSFVTVHEIRYYRDEAGERVEPPTRRIATGREYWLITFADWETQETFQQMVLKAIHRYQGTLNE